MIKLVEVKEALVGERSRSPDVVKDFIASEMSQAKLDTTGDPRSVGAIYSGIYQYLRARPEIKVKVQMVDSEIYLTKFV